MLPVNWMVKLCIFIVYTVNGEQYEPLAIVQQPIPVITRSKQTNGNNANHGDTSLSKNVYNSKNKQINNNLKVFNFPGKIGNNVYNKSLSQSTSKMSPQHSPLVESSQSSATINHGELADNEESGAASPEDSTGSGDYDYRANDLPDWMPPPPPPPPVSVPPPPSRPTSSSFLSSSPSSLQLGSFPGRTPVYPLPTHTSLFHVLPRHGPFAHRPLEAGSSHQKDEFTLFLVILTIAGFFGLIISMFMPFILLLQSQQQSLGSGLGGLQPVYPLQPGLVQPAQLGTGAVVANGKRRRRKRNDNPTVISIMASLHDATMKFRDS